MVLYSNIITKRERETEYIKDQQKHHVKPDNTSVDNFQNEHFITHVSPIPQTSYLSALVANTFISGEYLQKQSYY